MEDDLLKSTKVEIILVDGYSGHLSVLEAINKQPQTLVDAIMDHLSTNFVAFGHMTERIHVDAEKTLIATKTSLVNWEFKLQTLPQRAIVPWQRG